ncbi:PAS domain-containing protein [Streptomyces sp. N2-109]|uniref:PAS domain-containing protein n=1 Tax=Streptomyces gossypii TaxID=2883101 RepID=A0ABT2JVY0_9ACTN|nr:PAS domain-containing protein [Streptomyces gossypii]MCT2592063.1 PAS domain-containing protein [Streptomyces gossypii]
MLLRATGVANVTGVAAEVAETHGVPTGRRGQEPEPEQKQGQQRARKQEQDAIIDALAPVVDGIVATLGPFCEAVVHDFRRPEHSVVALAGSVTGRSVGGSMSEIGMGLLARGDDASDELNYLTRTQDGSLVKSSTMVLRDSAGAVFGALCVNLDVTAVNQAHALIGGLAGVASPVAAAPTTTFGDDVDTVVDAIVDAHLLRQNKPWTGLSRAERLELFGSLHEHGVFAVRGAARQVASRLGISRASVYSYLAKVRDRSPTDGDAPRTDKESGPQGAEA